jgi:transposase
LSESEREQLQLIIKKGSASIHTAKKMKLYWELLEEKGMRFYFLPPYSPELNRIELLWHKMKYEWLSFKTFTPNELDLAIDEIGRGFGSQYELTFC